jgi:hypothetical protein
LDGACPFLKPSKILGGSRVKRAILIQLYRKSGPDSTFFLIRLFKYTHQHGQQFRYQHFCSAARTTIIIVELQVTFCCYYFRISKNGKDIETTPPAVIENSHIFQEYTYKKITPCDICSQILRGKKLVN